MTGQMQMPVYERADDGSERLLGTAVNRFPPSVRWVEVPQRSRASVLDDAFIVTPKASLTIERRPDGTLALIAPPGVSLEYMAGFLPAEAPR